MPLYGYTETLDNRVATLVVAADTVDGFVSWVAEVQAQDEAARNFNEIYTSTFLDHMTRDAFKGYKHAVYAFYHDDEAQRDAFIAEHSIEVIQSNPARDRHLDMLHKKKVEVEEATMTEEQKNLTIEEMHGLDKFDPWDRRSDEEKEADRQMKEEMKKMRKNGELSGDSFGGADALRAGRAEERVAEAVKNKISRTDAIEQLDDMGVLDDADLERLEKGTLDDIKQALADEGIEEIDVLEDADYQKIIDDAGAIAAPRGDVHVTDIKGSTNADGSFDIEDIMAVKVGGEIDEEVKAANEAKAAAKPKKVFSPDDFAAVLRGDGSADHINIAGDDRKRRGEGISRPSLSDHAEAERKIFQEEEARKAAERKAAQKVADDRKALEEREKGIFRGADLEGDDSTPWDDVPETLREQLEKVGLKQDAYRTKDYPYNSELAGKVLLPSSPVSTTNRVQVLGGHNIEERGSISMGDQAVTVIEKKNVDEEAWAVYGRTRPVTVPAGEDQQDPPSVEIQTDVWLVRIR